MDARAVRGDDFGAAQRTGLHLWALQEEAGSTAGGEEWGAAGDEGNGGWALQEWWGIRITG